MDTRFGHPSLRILVSLCQFFVLGSITGCDLTLQAAHEPMHPLVEPAHLRASAAGYVDKIEIWIEIQEMVDGETGITDVVKTPEYLARTCNPFGWRRELLCYKTLGKSNFPDHTMVKYRAVAKGLFGKELVETYRFAAGGYLADDHPVPIRQVTTDVGKTLDVVIVRDPDTPEGFFRWYLDNVIEGKFFAYDSYRTSRQFFNFYYFGGSDDAVKSGQDCQFNAPYGLEITADLVLFLHTATRGDCTVGTNFSGELWFDKSIVHEAGHALYALRDEYPLSNPSLFGPQESGPQNLWSDEAGCAADAAGLGLDAGDCKPRSALTNSRWIIDPVGPHGCLMHRANTQWLRHSDYGPACRARVDWRHGLCAGGTCVPDPE